jgi:peroxiredoxin/predicted 2-oxoglutarate/Fe(II)-dependent dioxygenase YbiX
LERGDWAPDFVLPSQEGVPTRFIGQAGGTPTVLLFYETNENEASLQELKHFAATLAARPISLFAINGESPEANRRVFTEQELSMTAFSDVAGAVRQSYGIEPGPPMTVFVLNRNLRVISSHPVKEQESWAEQVATLLDTLPQEEAVEIHSQAPVLLIPDVLDLRYCEQLMAVWETDNVETGVERSKNGARENAIAEDYKRRRDHTVTDPELLADLTGMVGRGVLPAVRKAFSFRATRFEGFKIACYDAEAGGFFKAHRDNLSPATAHRRFALTLNLNDGYEGGHLRFPEYGQHLYRPKAGGAVVFSGSLLHEALNVTKGRRFVLLSFLFGEEDAKKLQGGS